MSRYTKVTDAHGNVLLEKTSQVDQGVATSQGITIAGNDGDPSPDPEADDNHDLVPGGNGNGDNVPNPDESEDTDDDDDPDPRAELSGGELLRLSFRYCWRRIFRPSLEHCRTDSYR